MNVEIRDERFRAVIGDGVTVETLGTGFDFTEGPVWQPGGEAPDLQRHAGQPHAPMDPRWRHRHLRKPSNMANGNAYDRQGRLVTCEHATSRVTRTEPDGAITVLATHYGDKALNSPNDIIVKSDGNIYFSDPTFAAWNITVCRAIRNWTSGASIGSNRTAPD